MIQLAIYALVSCQGWMLPRPSNLVFLDWHILTRHLCFNFNSKYSLGRFVVFCVKLWGFLREDGTATASLTSMLVRKRRDLESPGLEKHTKWNFSELVLSCLGCLVCVCHVKLFFEYSWFEHLNMQYSYSHTCSVVFANFCPSPSSTSLSSNCYCKCVFKFK